MIRFFICTVLAIQLVCPSIRAQQYTEKRKADSLYIRQLIDSAAQFRSIPIDQSYQSAARALELSKKYGFDSLAESSHKFLGIILSSKGGKENLGKAVNHVKEAIKLARLKADSAQTLVYHHANLSIIYQGLSDESSALEHAKLALDIASKSNYPDKDENIASIYTSIGIIQRELQLFDSAMANYSRGLEYYQKADSRFEYIGHANTANLYLDLQDYDLAKKHFYLALEGLKQQSDSMSTAKIYGLLGGIHFEFSDYDSALYFHRLGFAISKSKGFESVHKEALFNISNVYFHKGQLDSAHLYLSQLEGEYDSLNYTEFYAKVIRLRAEYFEEIGNNDAALNHYKNYQAVLDSLDSFSELTEATQVMLAQQREKNEQKMEELSETLSMSELWILIITISLIVALGTTYVIRRYYKNKLATTQHQNKHLHAHVANEKRDQDYLQRQLVTTNANLAIHVDVLNQIHDLLDQIRQKENGNGLSHEIKSTQQQIEAQKKIEHKWEAFFDNFEKVYPNFLSTLKKTYQLTTDELKICAFLKMNLSNKEICELLNINQNTIRVRIHRIKKKFNLNDQLSIVEFLEFE